MNDPVKTVTFPQQRPFDRLRAKLRFVWVVVVFFLISPPLFVAFWAVLPFSVEWSYWNCAVMAMRGYMWAAGGKGKAIGLDNIPKDRAFVFVCNHISHFDICAAMSRLGLRLYFVAKKEIVKIPFLGWCLVPLDMFLIDRSSTEAAYRSVQAAATSLRESRRNVFMYPEGGISRTGKLQPFKKGAFTMAIEAGVPIVPVIVRRTNAVFSALTMEARPGTYEIEVLAPIETEGYTLESREKLMETVREAMDAAV